ncbi:c-type cytochrome [Leptothrix discophora]|uniref:C-type cytochrome n=1 Tax=Leptothrix discophora TaxID=89 RepID=A0ABT9G7Z9_LEPDI|nr:c-type cytochrome [Leptothrix discophora]MDP4302531.1 c-type cytochrome [Leptothrix discophora]
MKRRVGRLSLGLFVGLSLATALATAHAAGAADAAYAGIGRPATAKELAAWDIDVRPDFKGLPKGSGSVAQGQDIWEEKCASCHGVFGEANQVFSPLVGGTTAEDVRTGRVARLNDPAFPGRTTLMKVATVSTLWDYINRAMPWNAPKSLKADEVYAVTAFLLNLGGVLPDNYVMSDANIAEVQARLPNRNGMTTDHAMWPGQPMSGSGKGVPARKPDVQARACMSNCETEPKVASFLPDFARNAHGNLAEQNRLVGAQHGADTSRPAGAVAVAAVAAPVAAAAKPGASVATGSSNSTGSTSPSAAVLALAQKHTCTACHAVDGKLVGPSFREIAARHAARTDALSYLTGKIRSGGAGTWGSIPMPAQTLPEGDAQQIAAWLVAGAKK